MRFLFISSAFPRPTDPRRAPYNELLCRALARGHDVDAISPVAWTELFHRSLPAGASEEAPPFVVQYPRYYYPPGIARGLHEWCMDRSIRFAVARSMERWDAPPDVVVSYWAYPDGAAAARIAQRIGVPLVMLVGGSDVLVLAKHSSHRTLIAGALRRAAATVAVSESIAEAVVGLGVPADRVHVVKRGVDTALFCRRHSATARARLGIDPKRALVLYVGRLVPVKGIDVLLEAAHILASRGIDHQLVIAGDGPLRRVVNRAVQTMPIAGISLLGNLTHGELAWWYSAANVVAIPSRSEGIPNVCYEAAACGVPFVASALGGIHTVARDGIDRLVSPGDAMSLADAIAATLRSSPPTTLRSSRPEYALPIRTWEDSAQDLITIVRRLNPTVYGRPRRIAPVQPQNLPLH